MIPNHPNGPLVNLQLHHLYQSSFSLGDDVHQPLKEELHSTVFNFWPEWLFIFGVTLVWTLVTLLPKIGDCPRGYLGPGGKHEYGKYVNCTGGEKFRVDLKTRRKFSIHSRYGWISGPKNSRNYAYVWRSNMPRCL